MSTIVNDSQLAEAQQAGAAARMGMWLFGAGELVLFGGLFAACVALRTTHPEMWAEARGHLDLAQGSLGTVLLILSAFGGALAVRAARLNDGSRRTQVAGPLLVALVGAIGFAAVMTMTWSDLGAAGLLPGAGYAFEGISAANPHLFFGFFFLSTGILVLHVVAGALLLVGSLPKAAKGGFDSQRHAGVENGVLFVQLLTVVWFFLFPLLYLV